MREETVSRMAPGPLESSPSPAQISSQESKCSAPGGSSSGRDLHHLQGFPLPSTVTGNPRNSMSITNTKGLLNMPGQNNCFLNSAVQVLWHLDIFRRSFRELNGHACMAESCIFCALKELFAQFQYSQESALPPDALRRALAETFCDQRRFQLGFMDDAAECFENILLRIHFHIANKESEDMCSASHCIPHQKFAMTLVEQTVCHECGATSEPLPFTQMVHYVPTSALCSQAKALHNEKEDLPGFGELLKRAGGFGDLRDCPSSCGTVIQIRKTLMNRPEIVSIGLVWDSERPTIDHIMDVFRIIGMNLRLQDIFHSVVDSRWASSAVHQLVGIVTYYGKHYSTFFFHTKLRVWIYFDDAAVREIGPKWDQVVEKCCRGHFQPLLLLYADPHGSSVSTSTAPHGVTLVPGYKKHFSRKDMFGIFKFADKIRQIHHALPSDSQRRAMTPNPETSCDVNANVQPRRAVTPSGEISRSSEVSNTAVSNETKRNSDVDKQTTAEQQLSSNNFNCKNVCSPVYNMSNYLAYKYELWKLKCSDNNAESCEKLPDSKDRLNCESLGNGLSHNSPSAPNVSLNSNLGKNGVDSKNHISLQATSASNVPRSFTVSNSSVSGLSRLSFEVVPNDSVTIKNSTFEGDPYISRRAVENVLQLQKQQKQRSVNGKYNHICLGQRNSNSSLDSLDNICIAQDKNISNFLGLKFDIPESINISRRRDSGNWSGDRNSASSSSTTSLDNPYFYAVGNKRSSGNPRIVNKPSVSDSIASTDPGYDSFSLSSSDSYPSIIAFAPGKVDPRLSQILENQQSSFILSDLSRYQNSALDNSKHTESHFYGFRDECEKLCIEADTFLAKSVERENIGDISMAALLSDSAAAKARAAMDVPYCNPKSLSLAKLKHSMCIIRSCNLHKKLKEAVAAAEQWKPETTHKLHQNFDASHDLKHGDISSNKQSLFSEKYSNLPSNEIKSGSYRKSGEHSCENPGKAIEIYATLPKKSLKKKGGLMAFMESLTSEDSSIEKNSKQKNTETDDKQTDNSQSYQNTSSCINPNMLWKCNSSESGSAKSLNVKKKSSCNFGKFQNKDSDFSDYSSEWEGVQKSSLHRTYSGPPSQGRKSSPESSEENQTYSGHPSKKQHKIRRKLMGGFMRRKNRSLPDLREGQDQENGLSRSFDDSLISPTPSPLEKLEDKPSKLAIRTHQSDMSITTQQNKQLVSESVQHKPTAIPVDMPEGNKTAIKYNPISISHSNSSMKILNCRAHTPPPYKPPPPITGIENESSTKRIISHKDSFKNRASSPIGLQSNICSLNILGENLSKKRLLCASNGKTKTEKFSSCLTLPNNETKQNFNLFNNEMPRGSIVWLKELQMKQEEMVQKKNLQDEMMEKIKLQEEMLKKHRLENASVPHLKIANDQKKSELHRDELRTSPYLPKFDQRKNAACVTSESPDFTNRHSVKLSVESEQPTSVKYLASKFEKILKPASSKDDVIEESTAHHPVKEKDINVSDSGDVFLSNSVFTNISTKPQLHQMIVNKSVFSEKQDNSKDHHTNGACSAHFCGCNSYVTDVQFMNTIRSGSSCGSFRNANFYGTSLKDISAQKMNHRDGTIQAESKRPDKPPDYETAIQRLELIRNDRNLMKKLENNHIFNVETNILEQDKKKCGAKKSVTFSDKVVLVACAGDEDNDFIPNPLLERVYKQHLMQNGSVDSGAKYTDSTVQSLPDSNSPNQLPCDVLSKISQSSSSDVTALPCNLCHHKTVLSPNIYCSDCAFYMSRFQS